MQQLNSCDFLYYLYSNLINTLFPLLYPFPLATGLTCVAVTGTPSYSLAAAEAERRVANRDSLALALRVNGTSIPLVCLPLYLISYLVFIQQVPPPSGVTFEYLDLHLCIIPVICIFILAPSPHYILTVQAKTNYIKVGIYNC